MALFGGWPLPRSASCDVVLEYARKNKILYDYPEPGDIGFRMDPKDRMHNATHVFAVEQLLLNGVFTTIEGNTNAGGSGNGDGVYERHRGKGDGQTYKFARWIKLVKLP
jgi:hypothetical protein